VYQSGLNLIAQGGIEASMASMASATPAISWTGIHQRGAKYGYIVFWVIVASNQMAMLIGTLSVYVLYDIILG
jgi:Mn2+/Fe2+ NRAMP family transporter